MHTMARALLAGATLVAVLAVSEGWAAGPFEARGFTKHMVRFRHADADAKQVGDCVPEVVLVNAHDRTSTYQLMAGLFRLVCLNGLVVSTGFCETLKIRHVGDVSEKVVDGSRLVMEHSVRSLEAVRDWTKLTLGTNDRMGFARAALALRFGETPPIRADQLLEARRPEDRGVDLWTTFNVIQENVLRGGLHGTVEDPTVRGGRRVVTSRAVRHISGDLSLNRKLWAIAADFAALKKAA